MPYILPKVTTICNIPNCSSKYSTSHLTSNVIYHHLSSLSMWRKGPAWKTANVARPGSLITSQQQCDYNSESFGSSSWTATGKGSQLGNHTNEYHLPQGYAYPPPLQWFPGALQLYHHDLLKTSPSWQWTPSASECVPSLGPQWEEYDLQQVGYGWSQMLHPSADCRCTESASSTTGKQSSQPATDFQLCSTIWTSFWCTWENHD